MRPAAPGIGDRGRRSGHPALREAIGLHREVGDRFGEASSLDHLGDTEFSAGELLAARECWRHALTIHEELDHRDAEKPRAKLAGRHRATRPATRRLSAVSAA